MPGTASSTRSPALGLGAYLKLAFEPELFYRCSALLEWRERLVAHRRAVAEKSFTRRPECRNKLWLTSGRRQEDPSLVLCHQFYSIRQIHASEGIEIQEQLGKSGARATEEIMSTARLNANFLLHIRTGSDLLSYAE
ncbi:hypothetical protein NM208_g12661 [Fusarium decemcellulare]|uniref:Uncharacterized protein n=1 Tax=Fusarium decemcellulare TaxID=57161 RepID=A0ACC1RP60_9HYPO|nr:hypothetical protein NM208_g12661 [Fusarium decemcellulare]